MLTPNELHLLREHLEKAQNPVFLYDNDADGFCSFILLRRLIGRGKGIAIRTRPEIDIGYARKIKELNADYVFVLDRPFLGEAFLAALADSHIPLVWVDHHNMDVSYDYAPLSIFNSAYNKGASEPVTAICYELSKRASDQWIAVMGCISDHYLPSFASEFAREYPDMWGIVSKPFDAYYKSEIGRLAQSIGFGLKDSITHVLYLQQFMINCASPHDLAAELMTHSSFAFKYKALKQKYDALMVRARESTDGKVIFFKYSGETSMSADIANELSYIYSGRVIVVAYINGAFSNLSIRGKKVREHVEHLLPSFEGASGGGHSEAVGVRLKSEDLDLFIERLKEEVSEF